MIFKYCSIYFSFLWLVGSGAFALAESVQGISLTRLDRIDQMAQQYIQEGRIPPVVYAVARRGETVRMATVGAAKKDDIFRIYSMTKPVTTVAVLQLYEAGKFLLTDPVSRYLPEFQNPQVYVGVDQNGVVQTKAAAKPITIEDLLTHTAGLTYDDPTSTGVPFIYSTADIWSAKTVAEFSTKVAALPLMFEPGSRWHYSVAHEILGYLVAVVSGQSFDQYVSAEIFEPLGMKDTSFVLPNSKVSRLRDRYARVGETMSLSEEAATSAYLAADKLPYGGGGLLSTAADYLRFAQMLLDGGQLDGHQILGRKTVDLMLMDHVGDFAEPKLGDDWVGRTENRSGEMHLGLGYGYGGYVVTDVAANDVPGSVGTYSWGGTASTYFFVDRQEQLIGLFLTQLTPSDSYPLRAQFRGLVYQALED